MRYRIKSFSLEDVIIALILIVSAALIVVAIISAVINASNEITEGVLIDKHYTASHVTYTNVNTGKSHVMIPVTHPERYSFTIQGKKNGETVKYTFSVTEDEYSQYKIGDYYKR